MSMPVMQKIRGHGLRIQLAIWQGEGKPILCVHGLTANCRFWDAQAGALAPEYHIVAMDLRGRGLSGKPPTGYSVQYHCKDIHNILLGLKLDRVTLMGHSLGALICLAYAAKFPDQVERLILADGGGILSDTQMAKVFEGIKPSLARLSRIFASEESFLSQMKTLPFLQPWSPDMETYFRYEMKAVKRGVRSRIHLDHIRQEILNLHKKNLSLIYSKIQCPALILRATEGMLASDDVLLPMDSVERMLNEIPDAKYIDITGANHYTVLLLPNESRDRAIRLFLG